VVPWFSVPWFCGSAVLGSVVLGSVVLRFRGSAVFDLMPRVPPQKCGTIGQALRPAARLPRTLPIE
jgi:hypothetical protein